MPPIYHVPIAACENFSINYSYKIYFPFVYLPTLILHYKYRCSVFTTATTSTSRATSSCSAVSRATVRTKRSPVGTNYLASSFSSDTCTPASCNTSLISTQSSISDRPATGISSRKVIKFTIFLNQLFLNSNHTINRFHNYKLLTIS